MKIIPSFALIFLALCALSFAADCEFDGHLFNVGEKYSPPNECIQVFCTSKGNTAALPCGLIAKPAHCKFVAENPTKPYPECCPTFKC